MSAVQRDETEPGQFVQYAWKDVRDALECLRAAAAHLSQAHLLSLHPVYDTCDGEAVRANLRSRLTEPYRILAAIAEDLDQASRVRNLEPEIRVRDVDPPRRTTLTTEQEQEWARRFQAQVDEVTSPPDAR